VALIAAPFLIAVASWTAHSIGPLLMLAPLAVLQVVMWHRRRAMLAAATASLSAAGAVAIGAADTAVWFALSVALSYTAAETVRIEVDRLRGDALNAADRADASIVVDVPTRCVNRRGLALVGPPMMYQARRRGDALYSATVRIDGLTDVVTAHGDQVGEDVVVGVADALRASTRAADVVARTDQGVFHIIGPGRGMTSVELERRCRMFLLERPPVGPEVWSAALGIGSSVLAPWEEGDLDTMLARCDADLDLRLAHAGHREILIP
jgi:GGDEF domain-containing protein